MCRILIFKSQPTIQQDTKTHGFGGYLDVSSSKCDLLAYQVKQRAGDRASLQDMWKSQHTDFNEDTTNESASVACSNIRLTQKSWIFLLLLSG